MQKGNIFENIPAELAAEACAVLAGSDHVRIERIVSRGHATASGFWYDQDRPEWVMVLRGRARIAFEGRADTVSMEAGDWLLIPAHARHRVAWTDPGRETVWLAVHYAA